MQSDADKYRLSLSLRDDKTFVQSQSAQVIMCLRILTRTVFLVAATALNHVGNYPYMLIDADKTKAYV